MVNFIIGELGFNSKSLWGLILRMENSELNVERNKIPAKRLPNAQHPIEIEYWYVLPAIRRELATTLKRTGKIRQKEIADILGITEAAISQYIKGSRGVLEIEEGKILEIPPWLQHEINKSSEVILNNKTDKNIILKEINKIMQAIRNNPKEFLCDLHEAFGSPHDDCNICLENANVLSKI